MSAPDKPQKIAANTYFVQKNLQEELTRLDSQDQMLTGSIGGPMPEQPETFAPRKVLDVGCGTGSWLFDVANAYSSTTELVGIDINHEMVKYACHQAENRQLTERVQFRTMDALSVLHFPNGYFDLVNQRLGVSFVRSWDWLPLLTEFSRVTKHKGIIRLTENEFLIESNSSSLRQLNELTLKAFSRAGHTFAETSEGVTGELARLLQQAGLKDVQMRRYVMSYRAGTPAVQAFHENAKQFYHALIPFLQKWGQLPSDYNDIYQQALSDILKPDFAADWGNVTAWGHVL